MGAPHKIREYILKHVPSLLYFYNFIGPVSCLCFSKELITTFNEELVWLVDVDFYYRLFLKSNKKFLIVVISFGPFMVIKGRYLKISIY